jgi:hypothetical protein
MHAQPFEPTSELMCHSHPRASLGAGGDHPKAGKPMPTLEEAPGADSDGRRSKTPNGGLKLLEANRCVPMKRNL